MRILFAGTPATALPSLDALLASRHTVAAVLTRPDARAGRGRDVRRSPVALRADRAGLPVLAPPRPAGPEFLTRLGGLAVDCAAVVAYGALVPRAALDAVPCGWVNLHFSLLPAWRGAAPVQHALLAGDEVTGASTFRLEEELDTGPVYGVLTEPVRPRDTAGELLGRLATAGAALLVATLDGIESGGLVARPQPTDGVSYAPRLTTADARVDWSAPAVRVDRLVRAVTPGPGAWTTLRGRRVKLGPVTPETPGERPPAPGEITSGGLVGTGAGAVRLGTVQPEGRPAVPAAEWLRGLRLRPGDSFT